MNEPKAYSDNRALLENQNSLSAMLNLARQYALTGNALVKLGHISFKVQWVITN